MITAKALFFDMFAKIFILSVHVHLSIKIHMKLNIAKNSVM